jgi:hypothetical protein
MPKRPLPSGNLKMDTVDQRAVYLNCRRRFNVEHVET